MSSNCLVFHTSVGISSSPAAFLFFYLFFFSKTESSKPTRKNKTVETALRKPTRKPTEKTHEPITRIISKHLDIKLGPFTQEELDSVLRKIKNRKAAGLDEIGSYFTV